LLIKTEENNLFDEHFMVLVIQKKRKRLAIWDYLLPNKKTEEIIYSNKKKISLLIDVDEVSDQLFFVLLLLLRLLRLLRLKYYFHRILVLHHLDFHLLFAFLIVILYQNHFLPTIINK